jgi:hypothetical protein
VLRTFGFAQRGNNNMGRRHRQLAEPALRQRLGVDEAGLVGTGAVLHAHDLLERAQRGLHVGVDIGGQRPGHGVLEELAGENGLGGHGRVALEGRDGVVVVVDAAEHHVGGAVAGGGGG